MTGISSSMPSLGQSLCGTDTSTRMPAVPISLLLSLTTGILWRVTTEWHLLRTDPTHLRTAVTHHARTSPVQFPDRDTGRRIGVRTFLKTACFVRRAVCCVVHDTLVDIARWSAVVEHLRDVERADGNSREIIMGRVRGILVDVQEDLFARFDRALACLPLFRPCVRCFEDSSSFPKEQLDRDLYDHPNITAALSDLTSLDAALVQAWGKHSTRSVHELSAAMSRARQEERKGLSDEFLDAWGELEMATDLIGKIGPIAPNWRDVPPNNRCLAHETSLKLATRICKKTWLGPHATFAHKLQNEWHFRCIWSQFEGSAQKIVGRPLEQVVRFATLTPSWRPLAARPPSSSEYISNEWEDAVSSDERVETRSIACDVQQAQELVYPEDMDDEFLNYLEGRGFEGELSCFLMELDVEGAKKLRKKKKKKKKSEEEETAVSKEERLLWPVQVHSMRKGPYVTIHRILVRNDGEMKWTDVEKMFADLDFEKRPGTGSEMVFIPPVYACAAAFCIHRPHNGKCSHHKVLTIKQRLVAQYGWKIEMFNDCKRGVDDERDYCR